EPQLEGEHPLGFYVQAALKRNPEVLAAERHAAAQAAVVPQVTSLPDPMLTDVGWPSSNQTIQTAAGRVTNIMLLTQQLPWCGKLRLRGEAANLTTKIALTQLAESQLKVVEAVKLAYYNIYVNQRSLRIIDDSDRLLRADFIEPAKAGAGAKRTTRLDLLRSQVELDKLQNQRIELTEQLKQAQADLAKALSTSPEADLKVADAPDLPAVPEQLDRLYQAAMISRPELQGRLQAVSRDERLVELARLNYFPDVTVGFTWYDLTTDHALSKTANGENSLGLAVGINLPIWERKLRAGVREAQNRTAESARLYQASRDEMLRLIRRLTVQARAQEEQLQLFNNALLPAAERALSRASERYKVGSVNPVRVIDNWIQLKDFRLKRAGLVASLGQTLASLERVVGEQLTRLKESSASPDTFPPGCDAIRQPRPEPAPRQDAPAMDREEILPAPRRTKREASEPEE
ncbi:MAG TPA: TolC family protein, partial [Gemmataceae bacterium]|nr:TolC family protein [Gemmataceae bacterium]